MSHRTEHDEHDHDEVDTSSITSTSSSSTHSQSPIPSSPAILPIAPLQHLPGAPADLIFFDTMVFCAVFPCLLIPPLGVRMYEDYIEPERKKKKEETERKKMKEEQRESEERMQSLQLPATAASSSSSKKLPHHPPMHHASASMITLTTSLASEAPIYEGTFPSLVAAIKSAYDFSWLSWIWTPSEQPWSEVFEEVRDVLALEKRFMSSRYFKVAYSYLSYFLTFLLIYFFAYDDTAFSLKNLLFYSLRFYIVTCLSYAAVMSVHSKGNIIGYKKVHREREEMLHELKMKCVEIISSKLKGGLSASAESAALMLSESEKQHPHSHSAHHHQEDSSASFFDVTNERSVDSLTPPASSSSSSPASSEQPVTRTNALAVLNSIDALSKSTKARILERRLIYVGTLSFIRGLLAAYSAWCSGATLPTAFFYCIFSIITGFLFFSLSVLMEFELNEDSRRWKLFSAIHSEVKCSQLGVPFFIPLASLGKHSQNIVGWYGIRTHLRDLKGKYDFKRMEMMMACIIIQILSVCGVALYWSYFHLNLNIIQVYEYVLGDNTLIAFDSGFCLFLLLDMVVEAVSINVVMASHHKLLLEEELNRSFALNSTSEQEDVRIKNAKSIGLDLHANSAERSITDSMSQLRIVREKLQQCQLEERLCVYGIPLDAGVVNSIKTLIVSYAVVAAQTIFSKTVLKEDASAPVGGKH